MARPGTVATWATDTNYTGGPAVGTATKVDPTSPKRAQGWQPAEEPGAQHFNWQLNLVGQWLDWLAAGVLDGNWQFTGNVTIDGTMTFNSDVTLAAGKSVIISGAGKYKRGSQVRHIAACAGAFSGGQLQTSLGNFIGNWQSTASGDLLAIPVLVNEGETITDISVKVAGDPGQTVTVGLQSQSSAGSAASAVGGTATSAASNTSQTLSVSGLGEAVPGGTGQFYFVHCKTSGTPSGAGVRIAGVAITTTIP